MHNDRRWAAGLFDGEGTIFASAHNRPDRARLRYVRLHMALSMTDPEPVRRFHDAVGCGAIVKIPPGALGWRPQFRWQATSDSAVRMAWKVIGRHCSPPKQRQAFRAFSARQDFLDLPPLPPWRKKRCLRGHELAKTRYNAPGGGSYCRACAILASRRFRKAHG